MLVQRILETIRAVIPGDGYTPLHEPTFSGNEWNYLKECLDAGWVSSAGPFVDRFERDLVEFTAVRHAVAVVNGTAALHICLLVIGVERGDEVIIPALTFVATANAVAYCGAVPHFADINDTTLAMDPEKLDAHLKEVCQIRNGEGWNRYTGRRIKAVVPVHTFGHPADLDPLLDVCRRYKLQLIEDAAESLGSLYKGRHTGHWGRVSALSFNGNKIITTGGGGAVLTNDSGLAQRVKHLTTTAKMPHRWAFFHDEVGFNYRLPNINAALGCAQLERLPAYLASKRALAKAYARAFQSVTEVRFFTEPVYARSNYWLNTIILEPLYAEYRDVILDAANEQGIMSRPVWTLLPKLPMYQDCPKMDLSCSQTLEQRMINIPSSARLRFAYCQ